MKHISSILSVPRETDQTTAKDPRKDILKKIETAVNKDRYGQSVVSKDGKKVTVKPFSGSFIAIRMARSGKSTTDDLRALYKDCSNKRNFFAYWWGATKPKEGFTKKKIVRKPLTERHDSSPRTAPLWSSSV